MEKKLVFIFIIFSVFVYLLRSIFFAADSGGIEHDSGWFLGVARNLAQRGIYASYTNTTSEEGKGAFISLHGRYSVQDEEGYSYFPAGVTAGPGFIVPQALMMKLFGYDFWQFRLWSLISFTGLLFLIFLISYNLGGLNALVVVQLWLWSVPQLFIQFSYESYGEHTALFYLLLSFYTFYLSYTSKKKKYILITLSGLLFSLSVLTKYLFVISGVGFGIIALWQLLKQANKKEVIKSWGLWFAFFIIPIVFFELYRYLFLVTNFGTYAWQATTDDFILHFKSNGGGFNLKSLDWNFISKKAGFWEQVGVRFEIAWLSFLALSYFYFKKVKEEKLVLNMLLYFAFISTSLWFIFASPFGWTRHVWHGLIIGMILLVTGITSMLKSKTSKLLFFIIFIVTVSTGSLINGDNFEFGFLLNQDTIDSWHAKRNEKGIQGLPSNPILSLKDQIGLKTFFSNNINDNDKVYYLGWLLVSEASPIVDKMFFSIDRYFKIGQINPNGGQSYLIFGPYQKGKLSIVGLNYHDKKVAWLCQEIVYENPSYTLCKLKSNLKYENKAYE